MSKKFENISLGLDEDLEEKIAWLSPGYFDYKILKKSIDARKKNQIKLIYTIETYEKGETKAKKTYNLEKLPASIQQKPVLIVGAGPAGLFAALRLLERGVTSTIIEQGEETKERVLSIAKFWRKGVLNEFSNVGFGEGGAGLFSDGKLITRIKSPHIPYVMRRLVDFGAPEEIEYLSNPHVGSDKIRRLIPKMREHLLKNGCEIKFNTQVLQVITKDKTATGIKVKDLKTESETEIFSDHIVLAAGHSTELFESLKESKVFMEGKSFAMGFRIEHSQEQINKIQYKDSYDHPKLGAANYKLAHTNKETGIGVYSFCMCPGGYVLSSGTKSGHLVSNGMSNYNRGSKFANSALVVSLDYKKYFKDDAFGGLIYRSQLEQEAYKMVLEAGGTKELPAQKLSDFLNKKTSTELPKTSSPSGVVSAPLHKLFDEDFHQHFQEAIKNFERKMRGFLSPEALLIGVESRTSCPIRITRDNNNLESISHKQLYPCGEGAGYAGGITSAACDGIKVADSIFFSLSQSSYCTSSQ